MDEPVALLLTDLVDSAALAQQLGHEAMAAWSVTHDRLARDLLRQWHGREIDKTDGFLLLFAKADDALGYALRYHRALTTLLPPLKARAGLHVGQITVRENLAADVALGAKPFEADGVSKPIAARVMSTALGGQTLLTAAARDALQTSGKLPESVVSHGYWRVKGLPVPLELFEVGDVGAPFTPPPDSVKVYRVVLKDELWLPARELRHSLPAERDAFVGRRATMQELARRLDNGARLVSLLGVGGCGKTRLAVRFGWSWMGEYPGGVWFCDLAAARTLESLCGAVAQGLDVPLKLGANGEDPLAQIGQAIAGRGACLVILDNFEQLTRHAEASVGLWLERAAQARFIVTTREVLGIAGEEALALTPLPADDAHTLFMRRAAAASSRNVGASGEFAPDPEDLAAIAPLVKLLDGLPLAIELAAARVRTLSPRALLARMSERFKLLASSGGRQDRQATLRATFDWSWDLLSTAEKTALAQLSVFENGFDLAAAEAVIDFSVDPLVDSPAPWTVDVVQSLVDKSFVRPVGDERFDLLVSVQAYAHEHLAHEKSFAGSGPVAVAAAEARHVAWFAQLGPQSAVAHACADLDNLVLACRRAIAVSQTVQAAGALDGAWAALDRHGPFTTGVELAEAVCSMTELQGSAAAHAHAVAGAALAASGQREAAKGRYELALSHARLAQDLRCEAAVTVRLGAIHAREGRADQARSEHQRAMDIASQLSDDDLQCAALNGLGTVEFELGLMKAAQVHFDAALSLAVRIGSRRWQASLLGNLGNLYANLGQLPIATDFVQRALVRSRELGDRQREGDILSNLGMLQHLQGDLDDATATLEAALAIARDLAYSRLVCAVMSNLGLVHASAGRFEQAQTYNQSALAVALQLGNRRAEGQVWAQIGLVHGRTGSFNEARQYLKRGLDLLRAAGDGLSLGLLLCMSAECELLAGQHQAARALRAEAAMLLEKSAAGPASELGVALARLDASFTASPQQV
jgi:predicted ATPase/Flp pilus assembly protein TadD